MAAAAAVLMREDHGMDSETPDWPTLTEQEWLDAWRATLDVLERTRDALADPESGMDLTPAQVAHMNGEAAMLRRVLDSRGVDLEE